MARVIGIDYGAKRVGVAISDDGRSFAFPKDVLPNDDRLLTNIVALAELESVDLFVVGESDNPRGGMNTIMRRIAFFTEALKVRSGLPVVLMSEMYSTKEARRAVESKAKTRKSKDITVDAVAAAIILQKYLDEEMAKRRI
jgi:putative Holliday junction resolvase